MFVTFKDWAEREQSAQDIANAANMEMFGYQDAQAFALSPPPIPGFGATGGFSFRLQDRGGQGQEALLAAAQQIIAKAQENGIAPGCASRGCPRPRRSSSPSTAKRPMPSA